MSTMVTMKSMTNGDRYWPLCNNGHCKKERRKEGKEERKK